VNKKIVSAVTECKECNGSKYEVRPCTVTADRHCLRKFITLNRKLYVLPLRIYRIANVRLLKYLWSIQPNSRTASVVLFCNRWRIQVWADRTATPPHLPKLLYRGWSWLRETVCFKYGGKLSFKSLTLAPFEAAKSDKKA